jgi:hypothetical protein
MTPRDKLIVAAPDISLPVHIKRIFLSPLFFSLASLATHFLHQKGTQ